MNNHKQKNTLLSDWPNKGLLLTMVNQINTFLGNNINLRSLTIANHCVN